MDRPSLHDGVAGGLEVMLRAIIEDENYLARNCGAVSLCRDAQGTAALRML
jgi:hypothetical protein